MTHGGSGPTLMNGPTVESASERHPKATGVLTPTTPCASLAKPWVRGVAIDDPWGSGPLVMNGCCPPQPVATSQAGRPCRHPIRRRRSQFLVLFARNVERDLVADENRRDLRWSLAGGWLQHYLGHKNIQHTVRYSELTPERFRDFWKD